MSSPVLLHTLDDAPRRRALDPTLSFTVQAPAGSGKTELLIQRFLSLLAVATRPESIVAITFTRKAAGEMMTRITEALREANEGTPVTEPHRQITRDLARNALARDRELGWNLLEHPGRLRVQTIDSLCLSIVGEMPWLARLGGVPQIEEDANHLYEDAAHQTLAHEGTDYADAITTLLRRLDNDTGHARRLIASMLGRRDQWLRLMHLDPAKERTEMEKALRRSVTKALEKADRLIPSSLRADWLESAQFTNDIQPSNTIWPSCGPEQVGVWRGLINAVLTQDGWRQRRGLTVKCGFPRGADNEKDERARIIAGLQDDRLLKALQDVRNLPPAQFTDDQWEVLGAVLQALRLAVAELRVTFCERGGIDFIELGEATQTALGSIHDPSELAFHLDSRIEHLLVDEFQDTSRMQFALLEKLTAEWQPKDGRTLFIVGDPMQSIYRFRQAEVGLFLNVKEFGIGNLRLESLQLQLNRRSRPAIVARVNELLQDRFPAANDPEIGAIEYTASRAAQAEPGGQVTFDGFLAGEDIQEAACVVRRIEEARGSDPEGSIAILVRARTHLFAITQALRTAGISFQAVDIEPLEERTAVRDLLALTRALLNPFDRVAWLAVLRAPWCGLSLEDMESLVHDHRAAPVEECLAELDGLSQDGHKRAARVREIMTEAIAEFDRWPLRRWVERTWIRLGGPACLQGDRIALDDASAYLDLLEREQAGADLHDFDRLQGLMGKLYAKPQDSSRREVQIMTIHKAKGLEFDTVIVPGLGRIGRTDDDSLILSHEWRSGDKFEYLLAPIDETGADKTPLYRYLRDIEKQKNDLERTRQLYVAMTRAKQRLHLMAQVVLDKNGDPRPPQGTMLADLWPGLTPEEQGNFRAGSPHMDAATPTEAKRLHRLPAVWKLPDLPSPVTWKGASQLPKEPHEPSFEWVGESLRHVGTVVHAFLQRMAGGALIAPDLASIRKAVAHAGVIPSEIDAATERVQQAIGRAMRSSRCQWILRAHEAAQSEYAVTGLIDGEAVRGLVDRTFVENGVRWIVDFKTSTHEGGNLSSFLDEQQRRYRDQMERYASILAPLGNPVRLGLYFPLLDEWREWAPGRD